jgi:beta-glucuronidase
VFVDGCRLGAHEGGYTPFAFDLPQQAVPGGEHLLAVRLDNLLDCETVPQGNVPTSAGGPVLWHAGNLPNVHYDFFPFMGLHRSVHLVATASARLEKTFWTTDTIKNGAVTGTARFVLSGHADVIEARIDELGFSQQIRSPGQDAFNFSLDGVTPWSPAQPKLYRIDIRLYRDGELLDHYPLDFGFRTVAVRDGQFLLNGEPVWFRGFGRHEDAAVIGKGLNLPFLIKDFNLMRWSGANSFRTSHYPYAEEQMQMADRQGFLVIGESAANTLSLNAFKDNPEGRQRLFARHVEHNRELLERDYNHPSVIAWSLGNECEMSHPLADGYYTRLVEAARTADNSRPITCVAFAGDFPDMDASAFDLIACNVYPSWYYLKGLPEKIEEDLAGICDRVWEKYGKPILLSEFGADTIPGLHDEHCLMWTEEYQVEVLRRIIQFAESHPRCIGAHVWNFADFKVAQNTGRVVLNWKGVFTRDRHPKAAAHLLRQLWTGHTQLSP